MPERNPRECIFTLYSPYIHSTWEWGLKDTVPKGERVHYEYIE